MTALRGAVRVLLSALNLFFLRVKAVVPAEEISENLGFRLSPHVYGVLQLVKGAKIIRPAFERDLGDPLFRPWIIVHAVVAAAVGPGQAVAVLFQPRHRRSADELHVLHHGFGSETAAAPGLSGQQRRLADDGGFPAVTLTFPAVHPGGLPIISGDHQISKPFPDNILQRQVPHTAAAPLCAMQQLGDLRQRFLPAVTAAPPDGRSLRRPFPGRFQRHQPSKPLPGQILLPRPYLRDAAAVRHGAALEGAGVQPDGAAAAAPAQPDRVSVFPFVGFGDDSKISCPISDIHLSALRIFHACL